MNSFLKNHCGIYVYIDVFSQEVKYVGQTIQSFYARDVGHRNSRKNNLCDNKLRAHPEKYKMVPVISFTLNTVTNEELNSLEQYFIKKFNTFHDNNCSAWNLTSGGECYTVSNSTKVKMSISLSGENNPMFSKKHTEETKQKISESNSGENHPFYGKKHSDETKKKMSENHWDNSGENHPRAKYTLWNIGKVHYDKYNMFQKKHDGSSPRRCFKTKYKGYRLPIGCNLDFVSCEVINNLIKDAVMDEQNDNMEEI